MDNIVRDYCNKSIIGTFNATIITASSDDRLKFNENNITNGLEVINQLNPKIYDKSKILNVEKETHKEAGLIAQEVLQTDLSFCVIGGDYTDFIGNKIEEAYKVNYNDVLAYLISGVKELKIKVEILEQENIDLSNNVNLLQQENATIKAALNELLTAAGKPTI